MPKFRYRATDSSGKLVSGELEATGADDAIEQLTARGLTVDHGGIEEIPTAGGPPAAAKSRLSAEEAAEVAQHMAELAAAGLPLAPGLRALGEELPRGHARHVLELIAERVEAGDSLEAAIHVTGGWFPAHLRGLILAGMRTGRLPQALQQFVAFQRDRSQLRYRLLVSLAYPALLLTVAVGLYFFISAVIIPGFEQIFIGFDAELPAITVLTLELSGAGTRIAVGIPALLLYLMLFFSVLHLPIWGRRLFYCVPLVGPLWQLTGMVGFSRLMAMLLEQEVPLPEALWMTAQGVEEPDVAQGCRRAAQQVREGLPLGESLLAQWQFLPTLVPFVEWGQQAQALPQAFGTAAEMFQRRLRVQATVVETVIPLVVFVLVIGIATFVIGGLFMPLISLIEKLT